MKLGCHIGVSKGFLSAAKKAEELGAESFQVFTKNPRSLKPKMLDKDDAQKGRAYCEERQMEVITHTPYITNLSTADEGLFEATIRSLREDLDISSQYGAIGAVVHCGKHVGKGEQYGLERMIEAVNRILDGTGFSALLLLENTAGQGSELGKELETLMHVWECIERKECLGFCFDTCHGFAAGLWNGERLGQFFHLAEETGFMEKVRAIHLNDSKMPFGSKKDRHEKIGRGEIGAEAILEFLKREPIQELPVILETPVKKEEEYGEEIRFLKAGLS